ncbi:hypothetical protein T281_06130 [Rhodomicrobium udaipurense JA643]|nr:hypothetical protein T281_06130 [Rhodomicrobium udaipurense JA643]
MDDRLGLAPFYDTGLPRFHLCFDAPLDHFQPLLVRRIEGHGDFAPKGRARIPAAGIAKIETGSTGYYTWSERDLHAFEAYWPIGSRARLAFDVMIYLGVRRSDAVCLGPQQESRDGHSITFQVWKGRKKYAKTLTLPILAPLRT